MFVLSHCLWRSDSMYMWSDTINAFLTIYIYFFIFYFLTLLFLHSSLLLNHLVIEVIPGILPVEYIVSK